MENLTYIPYQDRGHTDLQVLMQELNRHTVTVFGELVPDNTADKYNGMVDDSFVIAPKLGQGRYDGVDGNYFKIRNFQYWTESRIESAKKAIASANEKTTDFTFEYISTSDFEVDIDDDRTWDASLSFKVSKKVSELTLEFSDSGDGVEYEIWIDPKTQVTYRVPIQIVRDFSNAEVI